MKIGVLNFFPAFSPPRSGGELRYYHLYTRLGQWHDVEMANPTYPDHARSRVEHGPRVVEHRIPKTGRYIWWHRFFDRTAKFRECSALVCGLAAPSHGELAREARRLWQESDVFVHEFPYLHSLAPRPRRGQLMVYDAHNVEARLAVDMFPGLMGRWARRKVAAMERECARASDLVLACSEGDAADLVRLYGLDPLKVVVVPNGVDDTEIRPAPEESRPEIRRRLKVPEGRPAILFFGSFHPPNIDAVEYIVGKLANALTDVDFLVAGRVCNAFEGRPLPGHVKLLGAVDDPTKIDLLQGCDVAINPMFSGGGTNLKMLEYLSAGLPTVTTTTGARGLSIEHRRHAMIVEEGNLLQGVLDVLGDSSLAKSLARNGREHVASKFSWGAITQQVHELLELKTRRRVILLNDFPVSPVVSGGQSRLISVGRKFAESGRGVTILTLSPDEKPRRTLLGERLEELNVPRSNLHRWMDKMLYHHLGVGADDVSAYLFGWLTPEFSRALRRESRLAEAAILSHCYQIPHLRDLPPEIVTVHESFNVELDLKRQLYPQTKKAGLLIAAVRRAEQRALLRSTLTSCVSAADIKLYREEYDVGSVAFVESPNGADCRRLTNMSSAERRRLRGRVGLGEEPIGLFLASGHPPNAEAARFILDTLAPHLPKTTFLIVGQVCGWLVAHQCPANVVLLGTVSEEAKDFLLQVSDFALNPMFTGGGTNIKLIEYMAAGLPVVTTPLGARGFRPVADEAIVVAEPNEFVEAIERLLESADEFRRRSERSREVALNHFDWSVTLSALTTAVEQAIDRKRKSP